MNNSISDIEEKVKSLGIATCHNWLDKDDLLSSKSIVEKINCSKGDYRGIFEKGKFQLIEFFLKFRFNKFKYTKYFYNLSEKLKLEEIADEIFDQKSSLARVDCWISPISDEPVLDWHFDYAYSGAKNITKFNNPEDETIKFFFYLTDVSSNNGCLSYIPNSHVIAMSLRKGIYEKKLKYTPYWLINDFRKTILIKENYNYLKENVDSNLLNSFIEKTEPSVLRKDYNTIFDYQPIKAGGAVIFNDAGAHRGSKTLLNNRMALRFFLKKKK